MNLLGKIFVVLIFIMSLMLMTFECAVYATRRNWKNEIDRTETNPEKGGWAQRKKAADEKFEKLTAERDDLQKKMEVELAARRQVLAKVEAQLSEKSKELETQKQDRNALFKQKTDLTTQLKTATDSLDKKTAELDGYRNQIRGVQQEIENKFKQIVDLTEKVNQTTGDLARQNERNKQLAEDIAKAKLLLSKFGVTIETPINLTPMPVDGVVLAVSGAQSNLLEISLGSDDSIRVGHTIEVYREGKYLGRAQITMTTPDRAVAAIDSKLRTGPIQKGDRVTTRLKI